ncbi:MAG: TusE/DsrC/DsvC family sulfur relay protein [Pseudomonadota bacterium]
MSITVNGKTIETDEEGYLLNMNDWDESTMGVLISQHEAEGHKPLNDTAIGLIGYFRDYYEQNHKHPTMHLLLKELGMREGESFDEGEKYKTFLYEMFPHGPVQKLAKLAGLPNPGNENEG